MVYPPEDGHPSQYLPGPTWVNFVHATNGANHYATQPMPLMGRGTIGPGTAGEEQKQPGRNIFEYQIQN